MNALLFYQRSNTLTHNPFHLSLHLSLTGATSTTPPHHTGQQAWCSSIWTAMKWTWGGTKSGKEGRDRRGIIGGKAEKTQGLE